VIGQGTASSTITSTATGLMHVYIRNGSAANSITV
jgi:hypothetical protein